MTLEDSDSDAEEGNVAVRVDEMDEVEKYMAMRHEVVDCDILRWWKAQSTNLPNLALMARQFHGSPASSGGAERLFSAAGQLHGSLRKCVREDILPHCLRVRRNVTKV